MNRVSKEIDFLELHKDGLQHLGFWQEGYKETLLKSAEQNYRTEIIRDYTITDIIFKDNNKFLMKWVKRFKSLTKEELKEQYGR